MKKMNKLISPILILISTQIFAQDVSIKGPTEAKIGDLVVLEVISNPSPISSKWLLVNSNKTYLPVENGRLLVFASGEPQKYIFVLVTAYTAPNPNPNPNDDPLIVKMLEHAVTITSPIPPPTPIPPVPPPTPPTPTPPSPPDIPEGKYGLAPATYKLAISTNDLLGAALISDVFSSVAASISAGALKTMAEVNLATKEGNQRAIPDATRKKMWEDKFFLPLSKLLTDLYTSEKMVTVQDQEIAWREIALGLKEASKP